jgi:acetyltransferase
VRLLGPGALGVIRPDLALNASLSDIPVLPGRLALIAQSGAVASAMLDFAAPLGIGFSSVLTIGDGVDLHVGELLDALVLDARTDGILLYLEAVRNARRFLSALRAAARTKPVIVLKAGRSMERFDPAALPPDAVFDAALRRAGTVRVDTYTQLFAAARILALGRVPAGDRLAIIANGRGPALLAADTASRRGVPLAELAAPTRRALEPLAIDVAWTRNPIAVRGDASPGEFADAMATALADPNVDALVALHVSRPALRATDAARSVAAIAREAGKPVLGAWLGAIDRVESREALEAGGIANFYTPENAVDAFSFLAAYRRHQALLLEVPSPQPEPEPPDQAEAERVRSDLARARRSSLLDDEAVRLLAAFGIVVLPSKTARTVAEAKAAARALGYPVSVEPAGAQGSAAAAAAGVPLTSARDVERACAGLAKGGARRGRKVEYVVRKLARRPGEVGLRVAIDRVFGPVIALTSTLASRPLTATLMLPPLNRTLAADLVDAAIPPGLAAEAEREAAIVLLVRVSTLVCALPWVTGLAIEPLVADASAGLAGHARIEADTGRSGIPGYGHMAIHPYPAELERNLAARDGTRVTVRPIRPEDAELERAFVAGLSEQTRYFRFFYRMHELTPAMLARFTQVDYDRELALVALVADAATPAGVTLIAVARYIENPDRASAEYAIVVADAWQARGIGRLLMHELVAAARAKGLERLEGAVLRQNRGMLAFVERLGFAVRDDPDDPEQVQTTLTLRAAAR